MDSEVNKKLPFNDKIGCVGVKGVIYLNITYWVDVEAARKKQQDMIKKQEDQKYCPDFSRELWFSTEDFDDLLRRVKLVNKALLIIVLLLHMCTI